MTHPGPSHNGFNQMLREYANKQRLAVVEPKEADCEARGGRLKRRRRTVADGTSSAKPIGASARTPIPGENHAGQDPNQDDEDYHPGTESPCQGRAFVTDFGLIEDGIEIRIEEEEEGLPLFPVTAGGLGSRLSVNAQPLEDEHPSLLHYRPTQPRRLHGTDSEDDNPFPLHLRPKQPRRLLGRDYETEDAKAFPPYLRPKHSRCVMSSDEGGGNALTQSKSSVPTGNARDSTNLLEESQSHSTLGTCSAATSSTESLNSMHLPEPDPRERLFSSIPAVPLPPCARTIGDSLEMYSNCSGDLIRHLRANVLFNLPTFEPLTNLPTLPTLPSPSLSSPSSQMTPAAPHSTPTQGISWRSVIASKGQLPAHGEGSVLHSPGVRLPRVPRSSADPSA